MQISFVVLIILLFLILPCSKNQQKTLLFHGNNHKIIYIYFPSLSFQRKTVISGVMCRTEEDEDPSFSL